ncbi:MAG: hypothetical protein HY293_07785 [Planctomycetes bacterium]|nr:hypothetical protein [Planctomycetota bacterium]
MKKATFVVGALALLIVLAFLLHRNPAEQRPSRPPPKPLIHVAPDAPATSPETPPAVRRSEVPPAPALPGSIRGGVKIKGPIPPRKILKLDVDPKCQSYHAGPVMSDALVADAGGNVQWAFVYVKSGPIGTPPPAPTTPVLMDQIRCVFTPHMVGVRVGQPLRVLSSDDLLHNVHALPFQNNEFNVGLYTAGLEVVRTFDKPELMVKIKCDVHPWMSSWICVMEHPYFSITNEIGSYGIHGLPPGRFVVEVLHEGWRPVSREVEVPSGGDAAADFLLDLKRD